MKTDNKSLLVVLISPSGGGKTTIAKQIVKRNSNIHYSISYTTRPKRVGESSGKDYFFVSEVEFEKLKKEGEFLESAFVHGHYYATSKSYIQNSLAKGIDIIMDIDVQGAIQLQQLDIKPLTIFIIPPSIKMLLARLKERGQNSEEDLALRMRNLKIEISKAHLFDYLVLNNQLKDAICDVENIVKVQKMKMKRNRGTVSKFLN